MKFVIVAGTPGAGKTAVLLHLIKLLKKQNIKQSVVKVDCLNTDDDKRFSKLGIPVLLGLSKDMCPDHFSIYNIDEMIEFAKNNQSEMLIMETAGLCHRCAPYITNSVSICVIDATSGPNNPTKVGPFLSNADFVVITKGDMISQAEREIFRERIIDVNPSCKIFDVNGLNGQGCVELAKQIISIDVKLANNELLRHNAPFAVCTLCVGEKRINKKYHRGLLRKIDGFQKYVGE
ncbi:MAG: hypothetical protein PF487_13845 [Bacteroidales bacterium]|jgi:Ni2+-binding GTPase involved in maturation of urease and hydrogenase|nr:hypothetical protein [Bacteroidales bacterium]